MPRAPSPVLGAPARAALRAFLDRPTLFAFDLDGTLAPIVARPSQARVPAAVRLRLAALSRLAPLAVLTGRSRADALRRLGFSPPHLVGNHGAEGLPGRARAERAYVRLARGWVRQLRTLLPDPSALGVTVEDKGATLALHYRHAPHRLRAHRAILRAAERLDPPPRRVPGKYVENLLPPAAPGKGEALAALMRRLGCPRAFYVGDDHTDEEVFRLGGARTFGVRVGCARASAAAACLRQQRQITALLDELLAIARTLPRATHRARRPRSGAASPPPSARMRR